MSWVFTVSTVSTRAAVQGRVSLKLQTNSKHSKSFNHSAAVLSYPVSSSMSDTDANTRLPDGVSFHNKTQKSSLWCFQRAKYFVISIIGWLIFAIAHTNACFNVWYCLQIKQHYSETNSHWWSHPCPASSVSLQSWQSSVCCPCNRQCFPNQCLYKR